MNSALRLAAAIMVVALTACTTPPAAAPTTAKGTTAAGSALPPDQLLAAVQRAADQMDQTRDAAERTRLLTDATTSAQQCLAKAPDNGACQYAQAQVLGLSARERPLQAAALLKEMLASLAKAESADPGLDHAGPARLTAVVLLRALPWPLGPGDVDAAVVAAQRAVKRDPAYPPNLIALAQAQAKSDGAPQARATFAQAQAVLQTWPVDAERTQWQATVAQGLQQLQ
jgi:hypothetical protein